MIDDLSARACLLQILTTREERGATLCSHRFSIAAASAAITPHAFLSIPDAISHELVRQPPTAWRGLRQKHATYACGCSTSQFLCGIPGSTPRFVGLAHLQCTPALQSVSCTANRSALPAAEAHLRCAFRSANRSAFRSAFRSLSDLLSDLPVQ